MSTNRRTRISEHELEKGPNGFYLCRWCKQEVMPPKQTFCSQKCIHEWKIRSDTRYAKTCVQYRDHGICAECGTDTLALAKEIETLPPKQRRARLDEMKVSRDRYVFWEMDHRVEVAEGGGETGLENLVTLCVPCHRAKTAKYNSERAKRRAQENDDG